MARSGRALSSATSRSSGQLRSWSARVRAGVVRPDWTSLLRYSPGRHRGRTSRHGAKRAGHEDVDLHHGAATDVGLVRKVNEDSFLVAPPVFVVADGMGGHAGGDVASQIVVEEFARLAESATTRDAGPSSSPTPSPARRRGSSSTATPHRGRCSPAGTPAPPPWWRCSSTTTASPSGCWPTSATPGSTASPSGRLEQVSVDHSRRPGAHRRRRDHRRGSVGPPRAPRHHPRARQPRGHRGPTSSCCRWARSSGCCSAATASPG